MRTAASLGLSKVWGYEGVCLATPLAWLGAVIILVPAYFLVLRRVERHQQAARSAESSKSCSA